MKNILLLVLILSSFSLVSFAQDTAEGKPSPKAEVSANNEATEAKDAVAKAETTASVAKKTTKKNAQSAKKAAKAAKAEKAQTKAAKAEVSTTETNKVETAKQEVSKAETKKAETAKAEVSKTETKTAEATKPEIAKPETSKAEVAIPGKDLPEAAQTEPGESFVAPREMVSQEVPAPVAAKKELVVYEPKSQRDPTLSPDDYLLIRYREQQRLAAQEAERQRKLAEERRKREEAERLRQLELARIKDPTREVRGKIKIDGIVGQEVFIGDKVYTVGNKIFGARIVEVTPDSVVFLYKGHKFVKKMK